MQQTKINSARSLPCSRFLCDRDFAGFEFVLFSTSCVEKSLIFLFALLLVVIRESCFVILSVVSFGVPCVEKSLIFLFALLFVVIRAPFSWSVDVHVFVFPFEVPRNISRLDYKLYLILHKSHIIKQISQILVSMQQRARG